MRTAEGEVRTLEQIREHYEIERGLANQLRNASPSERRHLYSSLYNELYARVPLHPQLTRKESAEETMKAVAADMRFLRPFLKNDSVFLEVGPGDCSLSTEVAKYVQLVYAVDVSSEITKNLTLPQNFRLIISDGSSVPVPPNSVNVAYSNQLMEHLHPDDAFLQLKNIHTALAPGGLYICITPNRLNGPHDVSKYFDQIASGFHLREYTTTELCSLFRKVGFSDVYAYISARAIYQKFPLWPISLLEKFLVSLPYSLRIKIGGNLPLRPFLSIRIVGRKQDQRDFK